MSARNRSMVASLAAACALSWIAAGDAAARTVVVDFTGGVNATLKGVYVQRDYWFELSDDWEFKDPCKLDLLFSHSPIVVSPISTLTVSINGSPVESIHLTPANGDSGVLSVNLPPCFFKGGMNVLAVTVKMRSDNKDLCEDVHNPALWTLLDRRSHLEVTYEDKQVVADLARFPDSYANPDLLYSEAREKVHAMVLMPSSPSQSELDALGALATAFGQGIGMGKGEFRVVVPGKVDMGEIRDRQLVAIGKADSLAGLTGAPWGLPLDISGLKADTGGHLMEFASPLNPHRRLLVITGRDDVAMKLVSDHLKSPPSIRNLKGGEITFYKPPAFETGLEPRSEAAFVVRLADLKMSDIFARGKFYHSITFTMPNPYVGKVKDGAFLRLSMSHSDLLLPQSSSLLVKMNGEPVKSIRLTRDTAGRNTWDVKLPIVYLNSRFLTVELEVFMDIGDPDCYYNHPEMAWFALHNDTFIYLPVDTAQGETLANYPYMFLAWNRFDHLVAVVAEPVTNGNLSALFNVLAYLAQSLRSPTFVELAVTTTSEVTQEAVLASNLLVVGPIGSMLSDKVWNQVLPRELAVRSPDRDPSDLLNSAGFLTLVRSPFSKERHVLTVVGRSDDEIGYAAPFLYSPGKVEWVRGTLAAVMEDRELRVLLPPTDDTAISRFDPTKVRFEEKDGKLVPILETPKPVAPPSRHNVAYLVFFLVAPILVLLAILRLRAYRKEKKADLEQ